MPGPNDFDLRNFLPYTLAMAADATSLSFQKTYRAKYGMLRTEWRVLFHLGSYGAMTAKQICARANLHKTKVSRAVTALERKRLLQRRETPQDRRSAELSLTRHGRVVFDDLSRAAQSFDAALRAEFTQDEADLLHRCLTRLADLKS